MRWIAKAGPGKCESPDWRDCHVYISQDIRSRINALLDDVWNGTDTGSEAESLHRLTDAFVSVWAMEEDEPFNILGDGFIYRVEEMR